MDRGSNWGRRVLLALCCAAPAACAVPPAGAGRVDMAEAASISAISLERNCNGCPSGSLLVLRRDGFAQHTATGNARMGTEDRVSRAALAESEFDALARLLLAQRFFELEDSYQDPQLQDGHWAVIRAARGGVEKAVFSREGAGPERRRIVESALEALRSRLALQGP